MDSEKQIQIEPNQAQLRMQFRELLDNEPKTVTNFVPTNAAEQKAHFLSGETHNPQHEYGKLDAIDFDLVADSITTIGELILSNPALDPKYVDAYKQFIERYSKKTKMLELAQKYNHAEPAEKEALKQEYMLLNIELYGEPKESIYRGLLQNKLKKIEDKQPVGRAKEIFDELQTMVQTGGESEPPYEPAPKTIEWAHEVIMALYGNMLARIPDQPSFTSAELKAVFEDIIHGEFTDLETGIDAAEGWSVDHEGSQTVNVKPAVKKVIVPPEKTYTLKKVRNLVVHELGIHMLRAIMGEQTDMYPLEMGLDEYFDSEEGLATLAEQALNGDYHEVGGESYITAGLVYFDNNDFHSTFEIKWRLNALSTLKAGVELTDEAIKKSQLLAYGATLRSLRGTDELPWFKDLAYYNGSRQMWEHLDAICGDDLMFSLVLLGKSDPTNPSHLRVLYESRTP